MWILLHHLILQLFHPGGHRGKLVVGEEDGLGGEELALRIE